MAPENPGYIKVLSDSGMIYHVCNMANVSRLGTVNAVIDDLYCSMADPVKTGYTETKSAEANVVLAKGSLSHSGTYKLPDYDPFIKLLDEIRNKSGRKVAYIVFENLEHIVNDINRMKELTGIILLLDDERYSRFGVGIIIVGTPCDLRDYISAADNSNTVINRISELPEIGSLTIDGAKRFVEKGFFDLLNYKIDPVGEFTKDRFIDDMIYYTDAVPQYMHELSLEVACNISERNGVVSETAFTAGLIEWIKQSMISEMTIVRNNLNSRQTKIGRNNQAIYALSSIVNAEFSLNDIEESLRKQFPNSTNNKRMNMGRLMADLMAPPAPLIRKSKSGNQFRFVSPKSKIMIRILLSKGTDEKISVNTHFFESKRNGTVS